MPKINLSEMRQRGIPEEQIREFKVLASEREETEQKKKPHNINHIEHSLEQLLELEKLAENITNRAIRYAEHAGRRRLIKKSDILLTKGNDNLDISNIKRNYPLSYRRPRNLRPNARRTKKISIEHK